MAGYGGAEGIARWAAQAYPYEGVTNFCRKKNGSDVVRFKSVRACPFQHIGSLPPMQSAPLTDAGWGAMHATAEGTAVHEQVVMPPSHACRAPDCAHLTPVLLLRRSSARSGSMRRAS